MDNNFKDNKEIKGLVIGPALAKIKSAVTNEEYIYLEKSIGVDFLEIDVDYPGTIHREYLCGVIIKSDHENMYDKNHMVMDELITNFEKEKLSKLFSSDDIFLYKTSGLSSWDCLFYSKEEILKALEDLCTVKISGDMFKEENEYLQDFINLVLEKDIQNLKKEDIDELADHFIESLKINIPVIKTRKKND